MKIAILFPACLTIFMTACRQQQPVSQLKEINEALEKANFVIEDNNKVAYEEMAGKVYDPHTHDRALIWEPKMQIVRSCAGNVRLLIGYLKILLIEQSDSLQNEDRTIVKKILNADGNGGKLFEKLILFKDSVTVVFDNVKELNRDSSFFYKKVLQTDVTGYSKTDWLNKNFDNCSPLLAVMVLNEIEANVLRSENNLVNYCNYNVVFNFCGYYRPSPIASINNNIVKPGEAIMVTAGVGVFDKDASARITINGTRIKLYESPVARYEFIATGKPGTYNIPVKIEYKESDGSWQTASKNLQYIIADDK